MPDGADPVALLAADREVAARAALLDHGRTSSKQSPPPHSGHRRRSRAQSSRGIVSGFGVGASIPSRVPRAARATGTRRLASIAVAFLPMETSPEGAATEPERPTSDTVPLPSPDILREALADEQDEVLRRIDAGASSPEDLQALLAAHAREARARGVDLGQRGAARAQEGQEGPVPPRRPPQRERRVRQLAADVPRSSPAPPPSWSWRCCSPCTSSFLVLLVPVVGFLGYAWWLGLHPTPGGRRGRDRPRTTTPLPDGAVDTLGA